MSGPPCRRRDAGPASERVVERARFGVTQRVCNLRNLQARIAQQLLCPFTPAFANEVPERAAVSFQDPVQRAPVYVEHARHGFRRALSGIERVLHEVLDLGELVARVALLEHFQVGMEHRAEPRIRTRHRVGEFRDREGNCVTCAIEMHGCFEQPRINRRIAQRRVCELHRQHRQPGTVYDAQQLRNGRERVFHRQQQAAVLDFQWRRREHQRGDVTGRFQSGVLGILPVQVEITQQTVQGVAHGRCRRHGESDDAEYGYVLAAAEQCAEVGAARRRFRLFQQQRDVVHRHRVVMLGICHAPGFDPE